ncbi:MAG: hypothetical protein GX659_00830 [Myxococcales bacterium]|nr:hypothetical protein [Myxococcales bacterium]
MSEVGIKKFGDGWQQSKKSTSEKLAEKREGSAVREGSQASKAMDMANSSPPDPSRRREGAAAPLKGPEIDVGRGDNQRAERAPLESHGRAAAESSQASKEFLKNRADAANLKSLETKMPAAQAKALDPAATATRNPILDKGPSARTEFVGDPQKAPNQGGMNADRGARPSIRDKGPEHQTGRKKEGGRGASDKGNKSAAKLTSAVDAKDIPKSADPARAEGALAASVTQDVAKPSKSGESDKKTGRKGGEKGSERKTGSSKGSGSIAYAGGSNAARDLNAMLGGFGSGTGEEGENRDEAVSAPAGIAASAEGVEAGAIPESDPSFVVYSEFDTSHPGVEMVKSKAQLYGRLIEKKTRLTEIAKLNSELTEKISDLFKAKGLKDRLIGDLKDEIKLADMLGSPYGGNMLRG